MRVGTHEGCVCAHTSVSAHTRTRSSLKYQNQELPPAKGGGKQREERGGGGEEIRSVDDRESPQIGYDDKGAVRELNLRAFIFLLKVF